MAETLSHARHTLDVETVRRDFPILARSVRGQPLVYLDNAATSQKPRVVIDALVSYYEMANANVHRGIHTLADIATEMYEHARLATARLIGTDDARGVVFTRNTTEAINLVAQSWGRANLRPGDEIITTEMEHHSNLIPWQMIAAATGATLRVVPVRPGEGTLALDVLMDWIGPRTRLVAVTHCSNALGTLNPVRQIADAAHARGALVLVDGAQSVPNMPVDVTDLAVDFLAFSAHKMCGPTGIGVLWARPDLLDAMPPFLTGGSMIREVWTDRATWADIPARFEAGTPNIADAVAFDAALDYLTELGLPAIRGHEMALTREAMHRLGALPGLRLYGPPTAEERTGILSFNIFSDPACGADALIHPHDVATVLDMQGIAVRAGHHCCHPLMRSMGVPATVRASLYLYNTIDEIERLVDGILTCQEIFGHDR